MDKMPSYERYQRQMLLNEFGEAGQLKLLQARVLVVGAGGLGCPVLQYLAAAGVGVIGIVDDDVVSITNLHRQVLYTVSDVGKLKAERAASKLQELNPDIQVEWYAERLHNQNALDIISTYDIVVDGTDNFPSRYLINDACVLLQKPLVYGAISKFEGQVAVFNSTDQQGRRTINYRDIFPLPPESGILNCAEAGVLGVLPGIIGSLQAAETIKLITGIGLVAVNKLLTYNALSCQLFEISIPPSANTNTFIPKDITTFLKTDYDWVCNTTNDLEINAEVFSDFVKDTNVTIIDVRELGEVPVIHEFSYQHIPLTKLQHVADTLSGDTIITFCQSGKRSLQAATLLFHTFGTSKKIRSLKGGITAWRMQQQQSS